MIVQALSILVLSTEKIIVYYTTEKTKLYYTICLLGYTLLGGSWDLVYEVIISTLIGVTSIVTLLVSLVTKAHDPPSTIWVAVKPLFGYPK